MSYKIVSIQDIINKIHPELDADQKRRETLKQLLDTYGVPDYELEIKGTLYFAFLEEEDAERTGTKTDEASEKEVRDYEF